MCRKAKKRWGEGGAAKFFSPPPGRFTPPLKDISATPWKKSWNRPCYRIPLIHYNKDPLVYYNKDTKGGPSKDPTPSPKTREATRMVPATSCRSRQTFLGPSIRPTLPRTSINQSIYRSINQSINQSTYLSIFWSINQDNIQFIQHDVKINQSTSVRHFQINQESTLALLYLHTQSNNPVTSYGIHTI